MDLNGAIHILDDSVSVPVKLAECVRSETGGATRCDSDHSHVVLTALIDRVRHPVRQAAICGKPIMWSALRAAADSCDLWVFKSLRHYLKISLTYLCVGVHHADAVITSNEVEGQRASLQGKVFGFTL